MDPTGGKQAMNQHFNHPLHPALTGIVWAGGAAGSAQGQPLTPRRQLDQEWMKREQCLRYEERRKERASIARELHDTLFQGFLGASMMLQTTVEQVPADSPSRTSLSHALRLMYRVIDEGRAALEGLRSPQMTTTSLEQALSIVGEEFGRNEARYRIIVKGKPRSLKATIQEQIYKIGREALINALRHSKGTSIEVHIEYLPNKVRLIVRDNGSGIDSEVLRSGRTLHWGLLGMRERAAGIGAQLTVWSKRGAGTEVELTVAVDETDSELCD
jgi:signal transduction histidine kinase